MLGVIFVQDTYPVRSNLVYNKIADGDRIKTKNKKLAVIGFPFDGNSSYMRGASYAPPVIREAFHCYSSNTWSESGIDIGAESVLFDAGDIDLSVSRDPFGEIEKAVAKLLDRDFLPISLGGDHSITYPILKAFNRKYPGLSILHFDAHPDLYDELDGNRYSHACPFARIMETCQIHRLVQVGIRTLNKHQREQVERFKVEVIEMKDLNKNPVLIFDTPVYVSFDIDVLDPAFAPGGMSTRQAIEIIQKVQAPVILGADIVEFNPRRDPSGITAMVSAKILKEIATRVLE